MADCSSGGLAVKFVFSLMFEIMKHVLESLDKVMLKCLYVKMLK